MSIRLVTVDVDLEREVMLHFDWTSPITQIHQTAFFPSLTSHHQSPCTIQI